jgi:hypothetical protein
MSYAPPSRRSRGREREFTAKIPASPKPLPEDAFMARFDLCLACEWNLAWTCQHAGCAVCPGKQKQTGAEPLKLLLAEPFFQCPLKKFQTS